MSKKAKSGSTQPQQKSGDSFKATEQSKWFSPIVIALLLLSLVVLFSEFVFSDKMLHGSDTLNAGYYFRSFLVDYVKTNFSVPQWNPYIWGGMPFVEAFHGDIFYPLSIIKYFGPLKRSLGWVLFWHIFLSGIFMYLAARQFKQTKIASLFAGACFMFAPFLVSLVAPGHDGKIFVTTLFPLAMLFLDRGFNSKPLLNFSALGLVIGFIILSPHPQMSYFTLWSVSAYAAFKLIIIVKESKSIMPAVKPSLFVTYAVFIGLLLSAIQFYPGYIYTSNFSPRSETKQGWDWATSWSMHEEEAASLIIPEFSGTSSSNVTTYYWGKNAFKDNSEAVGAVALFLALIGAFFSRRKEAWFFGGLGLFALSYALAATTPLFHLYYLIPKVSSMRAASMIMFIFTFSTALLAGYGIDYIRNSTKLGEKISSKLNWIMIGFPSLLGFLALAFSMNGKGMLNLWAWLFHPQAASTLVQRNLSKLDVAYLNLPAIQSGAWLAFLFVSIAALMLWLYSSRKAGLWILAAVIAVPVIDGIRFDARFIRTVDSKNFASRFEENSFVNYLKSKPGHWRVMNLLNNEDNQFPYFGIPVPTGYHGNQLKWYDNLAGDLGRLNFKKPGFLNLMGAKYIISQGKPDGYFGDIEMVVEQDFGQVQLYRNENVVPRVFLADKYEVIEDRKLIYPQVVNSRLDLADRVILEEKPGLEIIADQFSTDSAWFVDYQPDSVMVGLRCNANKILVMTDVYFDAWKVFIDGNQAKLMRSYGALRAVEIPAGSKNVLFRYESERYKTGRLVTLLTSLFLLGIFGFYGIRTRLGNRRQDGIEE